MTKNNINAIKYKIIFTIHIIVSIGFLFSIDAYPALASQPALNSYQAGVSIVPNNPTDFNSSAFRNAVLHIKNDHANYITLIITYFQSDENATTIHPGYNTPDDASLMQGISFIHSQHMHVLLSLHLDQDNRKWRAYINPKNKEEWFGSYSQILYHYAYIATITHTESMCIGTELITMTSVTKSRDNTHYWYLIIDNIRKSYKGHLTYSANWGGGNFNNEKEHIAFWDKLDYIGISAYYPLTSIKNATSVQIQKGWNTSLQDLYILHTVFNKPILFTEVGYRNIADSSQSPWDYEVLGKVDQTAQKNAYNALFTILKSHSWISGVHIWHWDIGKTNKDINTDYTPENKSAELELASSYALFNPKPLELTNLDSDLKTPFIEYNLLSKITDSLISNAIALSFF